MALEPRAIFGSDSSFNHFLNHLFAADVPAFEEKAEARYESKLIAEARAFTEVRPSSFRRDLLVEHKDDAADLMFSALSMDVQVTEGNEYKVQTVGRGFLT
jgi:hypothetical protein